MADETPGARLDNPPQREFTAYEAALYFDNGDDPIAQITTAGVYTTAQAAREALPAALVANNAAAAADHLTGRWVGYVEKVKTEYEDWADIWIWTGANAADGPVVVDGPFT